MAVLMIHDGFEEARRTGQALISAGQKGLNYSAAERDRHILGENTSPPHLPKKLFP